MKARCMPGRLAWISAAPYSHNLLLLKSFVRCQERSGKHIAFPVRGQEKLCILQRPTKLSDKEHPWLISDDNVCKWSFHQCIPRVLIARLRCLLQQYLMSQGSPPRMKLAELFSAENIVADRRSTYQRQTISKG